MESASTIVVSGAAGFIGQHVLRQLRGHGRRVLAIDLHPFETTADVKSCVVGVEGLSAALSDIGTFTLVHIAWCPPVRDRLCSHAEQTRVLADVLDRHADSIERVVALGSAEEYAHRSGILREADAMSEGLSPYGWGKRAAQMLVETWCRLNDKSAVWLRPFTVYGENQPGNMAVPYAIRQARNREPAEFSAGTQLRDFIHVEDVALAVGLAANLPLRGFSVVNVGTGVGTQLRDVLERIAALFDVTDLFRFGGRPMRPGEPEVQIADTSTAHTLLGFEARISIADGLRRIYEAIK